MNTSIESAQKTSQSILTTIPDFSNLVVSWAESRGLLGSFHRFSQKIHSKLPKLPQHTFNTLTKSYGLLMVMEDPRLCHRCIADEKELSRSFLGPELQLLNNVQFHKPWKYDFFRIIEQVNPGIYKIESLIDKEISVLLIPIQEDLTSIEQRSLTNPHGQSNHLTPGLILGSILIPLGDLEIPQGQSKSELPGVVGLGPALTIPGFSQGDLNYWINQLTTKKGIPFGSTSVSTTRYLWAMIQPLLIPGCLLLSLVPELLDQLEPDEEPSSMVYQSIEIDTKLHPGQTIADQLRAVLDTIFPDQGWYHEIRSNWFMAESIQETNGVVQPRQVFYSFLTGQLIIRVIGVSPLDEYQRCVEGLNQRFFPLLENQGKPLELQSTPELKVGLSTLLLGQDLFGLELPGPPSHLINGLLIGY
jgi:hypothetical protein